MIRLSFFRSFSLIVAACFLSTMSLGGCGRIIALSGSACLKDLQAMTSGHERFGCMIFPKTSNRKIYAVFYKGDPIPTKGGQLYYCTSGLPASCSRPVSFVSQGAGGGEETAFLVFPPEEMSGKSKVHNLPTFLNTCANVFNSKSPVKIPCDNTGNEKGDVAGCWLMFYIKFNRKGQTGVCERLRDEP